MPRSKQNAKSKKAPTSTTKLNSRSPFKDQKLFEKEIRNFANKFKTVVVNHASRMSDYFEMSCFNYIVKYYERNNYKVSPCNLISSKYRYKTSTSGIQSNFSHFEAIIDYNGNTFKFEIHHNLANQSCHHRDLYTTPDISIIKKGSIKERDDYYDTKRKLSYVETNNAISFCEAKQMTPFPELLFNFIGVVNELNRNIIEGIGNEIQPIHIAPSLMISGKSNKPTLNIKKSLESRYCINIIYDLFYSGASSFSKFGVQRLKKLRDA